MREFILTAVVALLLTSNVFCQDGILIWGDNTHGQGGTGKSNYQLFPILVESDLLAGKNITSIATNNEVSAALTSEGKVYTCGNGIDGVVGDGYDIIRFNLVEVNTTGVLSGKNVTQIAAGLAMVIALTSDGNLFTWGKNAGRLGTGASTYQYNSPVAVNMTALAGKMVTKIVCDGAQSVFVITSDNGVYAWGSNQNGQLGDGTTTTRLNPVKITFGGALVGKTVAKITTGYHNANNCGTTLVLANDNKLYAWGINDHGQVGDGTIIDRPNPVAVNMTGVLSGKIITMMITGITSYVLTSDNMLFAWGSNTHGQVGDGTTLTRTTAVAVNLTALAGKTISSISAGIFNMFALTSDGRIFSWGYNDFGCLGDGTTIDRYIPVAVSAVFDAVGKQFSGIAGGTNSLALTNDGKLFAWGQNSVGEAGIGDFTYLTTPTSPYMNGLLAGKDIIDVALGDYHTLALTNDGLYSWGYNLNGQLGLGSASSQISLPSAVIISGKRISTISSSGSNVLALTSDNTLYSWGANNYGQLGVGTKITSASPITVNVTGVLTGKTVTKITNSGSTSFAITSDGQLYSWGYNAVGQLGDGTKTNQLYPVAVNMTGVLAGKTISKVFCSTLSTFVLTSDGMAYSWGMNSNGQLGDGTEVSQVNPIAVSMTGLLSGKTITEIAASGTGQTTLFLTSDGLVYGVGQNGNGQLGDGTVTSSLIPVAVSALAGKRVTKIRNYGTFSMALTSNGEVYTWGANYVYQLGDGTTTDHSTPAAVNVGGYAIFSIAIGANNMIVITYNLTAPTETPVLTDTPTPTPTSSPTTTETPITTSAATTTFSPATTATPTPTEMPTPTQGSTASPTTATMTATPTPASSITPTPTPTASQIHTTTLSPTTTLAPTPTPTTQITTSYTPTTTNVPTTVAPTPTQSSATAPTTSIPTPTASHTPTTTNVPTTVAPTPTHSSTTTGPTTPTPTPAASHTPTTTNVPTPTSSITPTPTPTASQIHTTTLSPTTTLAPTPTTQIQCFNVYASDPLVCSGNGACISEDNCQCNSPTIIGTKCEINMQTSSTTYVVFDANSQQSSINIDAANDLPDSSGPVSYSFTSDNQLQLSSSSSDTGRKGICLNPSLLVAGLQTFVAFSFPTALPSGVASEIWLQDTNGDYRVSSGLQFVGGAQSLELTADSTSSTILSLNANVTYILLLSVSSFGSDVSAQVITTVSHSYISFLLII
jgi:alpha-tubulin suppressor-like RCC1 family protein